MCRFPRPPCRRRRYRRQGGRRSRPRPREKRLAGRGQEGLDASPHGGAGRSTRLVGVVIRVKIRRRGGVCRVVSTSSIDVPICGVCRWLRFGEYYNLRTDPWQLENVFRIGVVGDEPPMRCGWRRSSRPRGNVRERAALEPALQHDGSAAERCRSTVSRAFLAALLCRVVTPCRQIARRACPSFSRPSILRLFAPVLAVASCPDYERWDGEAVPAIEAEDARSGAPGRGGEADRRGRYI
jgi:hypothetical protein